MSEPQPDSLFKLLIIGDSGVGKSCFLLQFIEGDFKEDHNVTIGVEYGAKTVTAAGKQIKLQIWDTAGQESFRAITRSFYRNANGVILMYDLTRMESFENLEDWLREIRLNSDPEVNIYLVGNMLDLADEEREVGTEIAEKFASEKKLDGFIEASAKTAEHVAEVFIKVAELLYKKKEQKQATETKKDAPAPVVLTNSANKDSKKKGCC
jgi:Ras-related protein Rab-2A